MESIEQIKLLLFNIRDFVMKNSPLINILVKRYLLFTSLGFMIRTNKDISDVRALKSLLFPGSVQIGVCGHYIYGIQYTARIQRKLLKYLSSKIDGLYIISYSTLFYKIQLLKRIL